MLSFIIIFKEFFMKKSFLIGLMLVVFASISLMAQGNRVRGEEIPPGHFYIKSANLPLSSNQGYWDLPGTPKQIGEDMEMQLWDLSDRAHDRQYRFIRTTCPGVGYDCYEIQIGNTGDARVTISKGKKGKGIFKKKGGIAKGQLVIGRDINADSQTWFLMHRGDGKFEINNVNNRDKIVSKNNATNNGADLVAESGTHYWYLIDTRTNRPFIPAPPQIAQPSSSLTLEQALNRDSSAKDYFRTVKRADFNRQNSGNLLSNNLNKISKDVDRLKLFLAVVDGTSKNNDTALRRAVYRTLDSVDLKGSNILYNVLKGQAKKTIDNSIKSEQDRMAKKFLEQLRNKF